MLNPVLAFTTLPIDLFSDLTKNLQVGANLHVVLTGSVSPGQQRVRTEVRVKDGMKGLHYQRKSSLGVRKRKSRRFSRGRSEGDRGGGGRRCVLGLDPKW